MVVRTRRNIGYFQMQVSVYLLFQKEPFLYFFWSFRCCARFGCSPYNALFKPDFRCAPLIRVSWGRYAVAVGDSREGMELGSNFKMVLHSLAPPLSFLKLLIFSLSWDGVLQPSRGKKRNVRDWGLWGCVQGDICHTHRDAYEQLAFSF